MDDQLAFPSVATGFLLGAVFGLVNESVGAWLYEKYGGAKSIAFSSIASVLVLAALAFRFYSPQLGVPALLGGLALVAVGGLGFVVARHRGKQRRALETERKLAAEAQARAEELETVEDRHARSIAALEAKCVDRVAKARMTDLLGYLYEHVGATETDKIRVTVFVPNSDSVEAPGFCLVQAARWSWNGEEYLHHHASAGDRSGGYRFLAAKDGAHSQRGRPH